MGEMLHRLISIQHLRAGFTLTGACTDLKESVGHIECICDLCPVGQIAKAFPIFVAIILDEQRGVLGHGNTALLGN